MNNNVHVVLGAAGAIGSAVVSELNRRNLRVRAVGKKQRDETVTADLLDSQQTTKAIRGASHVYVCVGLPYNTKTWQTQWPVIINNVIAACEMENAKLIFLDNVYMYGPTPLQVNFTENHIQNPESQKGKVRKEVADLLLEAHRSGRIQVVIGRSADFYGPNAVNSPLYISFLQRMLEGKQPQTFSAVTIKHTYSYTEDNGRALVAIALSQDTYGQVWHLPVSEPITMAEAANVFNSVLGTSFKISVIPRTIFDLMSIFIKPIKEVKEMRYQFDQEYIMSYEKFKVRFPEFKVTNYKEGLNAMVQSFLKNSHIR